MKRKDAGQTGQKEDARVTPPHRDQAATKVQETEPNGRPMSRPGDRPGGTGDRARDDDTTKTPRGGDPKRGDVTGV